MELRLPFHLCVQGSIPAIYSCLIIISPRSHARVVLYQFDSAKHHRFFTGSQVSSGIALTSKKNSLELFYPV